MIKIENYILSYGNTSIINNLNIEFEEGQVHGILGLNGAGKTTFFKSIYGLIKPKKGEIFFNDQKIIKEFVSFLPTENYFYSYLTGRDYLEIFQSKNDFKTDKWNELFQLPLDDFIDSYSTGLMKKLALIAIIKMDNPILILDEPFNGLDLEINRIMRSIIQKLKESCKTIFLSSHILDDMINICDEIHHLRKGDIKKSYQKTDYNLIEDEIFTSIDKKNQELINTLM